VLVLLVLVLGLDAEPKRAFIAPRFREDGW
jgi:hypothetical protein